MSNAYEGNGIRDGVDGIAPNRRNILVGGTMLAATSALGAGASTRVAQAQQDVPAPVPPSPNWARAMAPGPDASVKITEGYARLVARDAYFWAWPMVNIYNRRLAFKQAPDPGLMNGVLPGRGPSHRRLRRDRRDVWHAARFLSAGRLRLERQRAERHCEGVSREDWDGFRGATRVHGRLGGHRIRAYWPKPAVIDGSWTPPSVQRI
jgi:hypothetical protein